MPRNKSNSESLLVETKQLLAKYDLRARKGLAQHFLIDRDILQKITEAAELSPNDVIMAVGPGLGVLTRELVKGSGWVIAVELDDKLASILKENIAPAENITVVNKDILQVEPGKLIQEFISNIKYQISKPQIKNQIFSPEIQSVVIKAQSLKYKVVANLPYYITSAVLRHFLETASIKPKIMVIMVQKEIAQAIIAPAGDSSLLSASVQFYGKPSLVTYVPKESFLPAPKVASAVLRIDLFPKPAINVDDPNSFFALVKAGFKGQRKQLINSLERGLVLPKEDIIPLLDNAGIDSKRRAQTLTLEEWQTLYELVCQRFPNSLRAGVKQAEAQERKVKIKYASRPGPTKSQKWEQ